MSHVNTILGSIHPDEMGVTSCHEHIFWGPPGWEYDPEWWFHTPKVFTKCVKDLAEYRDLGGRTIVEVSGIGLGRDVEFYRMMSRYSGVHVVLSTAFWADTGIYNYFRNKDIDYLEEFFVRELTHGIGNTGAKAGVIKVGNSIFKFTELEKLVYRAAARAAKKVGCAIITHGTYWVPWETTEVFKSEGLDLSRVIVSHCEEADAIDFERDKKLARMGCWVMYDNWGFLESWSPNHYVQADEIRADLAKKFIDAGFGDRLLLANDVNLFRVGWQRTSPYTGTHGMEHLLRVGPPKFRRVGIKEDTFWRILTENPKKVVPIQ